MRVIVPLIRTLDDAETIVTSSTVDEPDTYATPPEEIWNAATNYSVGDLVIRTETHMIYENIQAGVNATLPEVDAALAEPTRWVQIGPTNRYAMFDTLRNTQTVTTSPLIAELTPGERIDSIGVFGMSAESITISMTSGGNPVYSVTEDLNTREVLNWYDYFFEPFSSIESIVKFDLPPYTDGIIEVELSSSTGSVSCGAVVIGNQVYLGRVVFNANNEELNFSRIERNFDGTAELTQRRSIPKIDVEVWADKTRTNRIRAARAELNAIPAVYSGLDDDNTNDYFEALLILGIYKRWEMNLAYPTKIISNIEIEEL
jgi:hypothetical protein